MFEYRLFSIQKEASLLYRKNPQFLYETLKILFTQKEHLNLGVSFYHQLCRPFAVLLLENYISDKVPAVKIHPNHYRVLSFYEKTEVFLRRSHILIKTDCEFSDLLKIFHLYDKDIFIVDFKNHLFFWLNDRIRKHFS